MSTPHGRRRSSQQPSTGEAVIEAALGLVWAFRTELTLLVTCPSGYGQGWHGCSSDARTVSSCAPSVLQPQRSPRRYMPD